MKKILFIIFSFFVFTLFFSSSALGQNKTTTPTDSITQQQIDELKSKIASKVAELNLVEKRGILGTVSDISDTQITLTDFQNNLKIVDVDELTKFYSTANSFGISDIKKGQVLGILGLYNKDSHRILAREVNDMPDFEKIVLGVITKVDKVNYEITVENKANEKSIFEIENTTKTFIFSQSNLVKAGFSKTSEFQTVIITGFVDKQSPKKFQADRVIILPNIDLAKTMNIGATSITATPSAK